MRYRMRLWRNTDVLWECITPWEPTVYEYLKITGDRPPDSDYFTLECLLEWRLAPRPFPTNSTPAVTRKR